MGFVSVCGAFSALLPLICVLPGCTPDPDSNYEPVSGACLKCLSEDTRNGCKTEFDACEDEEACDDYVLCQLMGRCFERRPNSGCEEALGCFEPTDEVSESDAGELQSPRDLAGAVESCARSTCADICRFVEQ
jgi:hypothetical protein